MVSISKEGISNKNNDIELVRERERERECNIASTTNFSPILDLFNFRLPFYVYFMSSFSFSVLLRHKQHKC